MGHRVEEQSDSQVVPHLYDNGRGLAGGFFMPAAPTRGGLTPVPGGEQRCGSGLGEAPTGMELAPLTSPSVGPFPCRQSLDPSSLSALGSSLGTWILGEYPVENYHGPAHR
jgi:hypothetical protein